LIVGDEQFMPENSARVSPSEENGSPQARN
jgi:hypothetical protein